MKKNKKKLILIISIIAISTILLLITLLVINIVNDKKQSEENMEMIDKNYKELSTNVNEYNQIRTDLEKMLNNFIYEEYPNERTKYDELLTKYNNNINKIDNNIKNINERCNVIYKDSAINKICDSYKITYEKLINLYVGDLTNYNNKVTSYNEYKNKEEKLFELIHQEYIDYNEDKVYEGKDVENEENQKEK